MESKNIFIDKKFNLQDYLYLGYAFLLIIGLFHETIFYGFLGVNFLEYSSVLDVLLSPIALLTGNFILLIVVFIFILLIKSSKKYILKYYDWLAKKDKYQSGKKKDKLEKAIASLQKNNNIMLMLLFMFAIFLGLGLGAGLKTKLKLQEKNIKLTHELTFGDNEKQIIKMIGKNSLYIFYVTAEKREIICAPIEGNIKTIAKLKEN